MADDTISLTEKPGLTVSKVVGIYQALLRRYIEHFFPDTVLDSGGDRSVIHWDDFSSRPNYRVLDEPGGLGIEIEWFRTRYMLLPSSPTPFLPAEHRLLEVVLRLLDRRFRSMFDPRMAQRNEMFHFAVEDFIVTEFLDPPGPERIPAALEALRVAALSTYENRRVSTGALLLGTDHDPAMPGRANPEGAPRYNIRLTGIKGFHRLCDGVNTVYLVDRQGDLARAIDINRWAEQTQGPGPPVDPCPRPYDSHAKATRSGGHVCLVLTPSQEIKVFAEGHLAFAFSDARWRMLDVPSKFAIWKQAVGETPVGDLARVIFQAALNLAEARKGALFVVLRNPAASIPQLIAPADRIVEEICEDDPQDPDNLSPRVAKRSLHHVVRGQGILDIDRAVIEALAGIDGAVVTDSDGRLLTFAAILRIDPEALRVARAVEGARTLAAISASFHGPSLKVSEDGTITLYLGGRRVWDL
jgi:hypothetical protein